MIESLFLTKEQLQRMIAHVDAHAPLEACGLLAGLNSKVDAVIEVVNQARSEVRFEMEPVGQLKAFEWIDAKGLELVGIFHSHPAGPETVSPTDIAEAAYDVVHVVLSRVNGLWQAKGFWIKNGAFGEVTLQIS
jgi:proteasome lid subunit RPN8/RPN11